MIAQDQEIANKAIFIDFDGTLCHDRFWRSLKPELLEKVQHSLFQDDKTVVGAWMNGDYTSEDVNRKLAEALDVDYDFLWNVFVKDCREMRVEMKVLEKLKRLRKNHKVVLITDNMDCFDRFTVPSLELDTYFDVIVNSFNEHASKNEQDGLLFKEVIKRVGSTPTNSVLIDNSKTSCDLFEALGGVSFFATNERPLGYWLNDIV